MAKFNKTSYMLRDIQMSNIFKTDTQQTLLMIFFFPAFPPSFLPFQAAKKLQSRSGVTKHTNTGSMFVNSICSFNVIGRRSSSSIFLCLPLSYVAYWNPHHIPSRMSMRSPIFWSFCQNRHKWASIMQHEGSQNLSML